MGSLLEQKISVLDDGYHGYDDILYTRFLSVLQNSIFGPFHFSKIKASFQKMKIIGEFDA